MDGNAMNTYGLGGRKYENIYLRFPKYLFVVTLEIDGL